MAAMLVSVALIGCGGTLTPTTQIRSNFKKLVEAARDHDVHAACELIFLYGEHQPKGALKADLSRLSTASATAEYEATIGPCASQFVLSVLYRDLSTIVLRSVKIHGDEATAYAVAPGRKPFTMRFVKAAGEWRVLDLVQ